MKVLGIDTSSKNLSVAIVENNKLLAEFNGKVHLRHSQDLIPTIKSLLKTSGFKLEDLDGFALSIGPGSFTGLRIGVSTVKGLSLALPKPIAAVPTLDVIAGNFSADAPNICAVVDAKKNKIYACIYARESGTIKRKSDYLLVTPEELLKNLHNTVVFLGDGIACYRERIVNQVPTARFTEEKLWFPKASVVASLGLEKLSKGETVSGDELVPMYLYSRECSIRGVDK